MRFRNEDISLDYCAGVYGITYYLWATNVSIYYLDNFVSKPISFEDR